MSPNQQNLALAFTVAAYFITTELPHTELDCRIARLQAQVGCAAMQFRAQATGLISKTTSDIASSDQIRPFLEDAGVSIDRD